MPAELHIRKRVLTLLVIKSIVAKKHAGIFQEMAEANKALAQK